MAERFVFSSTRPDEENGERIMYYNQQQASAQRQRIQVDRRREEVARDYWRENIDRVKRTAPGYCRRNHGQTAMFRDEDCRGQSHPTYREHPTIPGLQVEDVCQLCTPYQARVVQGEHGAAYSTYVQKARRNADEDEDEDDLHSAARRRTLGRRRAPTPHVVDPEIAAERRRRGSRQRESRAKRGRDAIRKIGIRPSVTRFGGMVLFSNAQKAPKSVSKRPKSIHKKKKK